MYAFVKKSSFDLSKTVTRKSAKSFFRGILNHQHTFNRIILKYSVAFALALIFSVAIASNAKADLYEIATAEQFLPFVKPGTIVFWDLDKTVMDFAATPPHDFQLVENQTPKLIADLQAKGVIVLSITRRERSTIENTDRDLKRLGIDFSKNAPSLPALEFTPGLFYQNGVV